MILKVTETVPADPVNVWPTNFQYQRYVGAPENEPTRSACIGWSYPDIAVLLAFEEIVFIDEPPPASDKYTTLTPLIPIFVSTVPAVVLPCGNKVKTMGTELVLEITALYVELKTVILL